MCLFASEIPGVRESLNSRDHPRSESRHSLEILCRRLIRHSESVNTECFPCLSCPDRSKIRTSVLLGTAHNCRGNAVCFLCPFRSAMPAVCFHKIQQCFSDRFGIFWMFFRVMEFPVFIVSDSDNDNSRTELRHTVIAGIQ